MKEVCSAFNISKEHCTKYVQFGNTFNLLHAAASFISVHQKSVGVAGVSDKYGKRSWARYPALWTLKHVDSLPNPDPSDIEALDETPIKAKDVQINKEAEALRPEYKRQAQEWAGIKQDPQSDLFVFVGRWSKQKGVDLIADILPSLYVVWLAWLLYSTDDTDALRLEKRPSVQVIAVGPVIDLYGRFAAEKLARLMELYPERIYSKPEFTALPPYLFSGADFALIPSRDEPFGLVAVEFGRKGALGVGSRLGGLGLMPGWVRLPLLYFHCHLRVCFQWYPVESTSTSHMLSQLTKTIKLALKSTEEERAILRARSAVQRFPVVEWRQRMEDLHRRSIISSRGNAGVNAWRDADCDGGSARPMAETDDWDPVSQAYPSQPDWDSSNASGSPRGAGSPGAVSPVAVSSRAGSPLVGSPGAVSPRAGSPFVGSPGAGSSRAGSPRVESPRGTPGQLSQDSLSPGDPFLAAPPPFHDNSQRSSLDSSDGQQDYFTHSRGSSSMGSRPGYGGFLDKANRTIARDQKHTPDPFLDPNAALVPNRPFGAHSRVSSVESIASIVDEKPNSPLNKAIASVSAPSLTHYN
jgi:alpha-1,3-glucan synthase